MEMKWYERVGEARMGDDSSALQVAHSLSCQMGGVCDIV